MSYRHTEDMGEISGFGGDYEACCQDMLEAGVKWLLEHPGVDLKIASFEGMYGLCMPEPGSPAEEMSNVILAAAKGEATGAMHHAIMERCFMISKHDWDWYCKEIREYNAKNPDQPLDESSGTS